MRSTYLYCVMYMYLTLYIYQNLTFYMCNLFEPKTEIVLFSAHLSSIIPNMVLKTMSFVECLYTYTDTPIYINMMCGESLCLIVFLLLGNYLSCSN